MAAGSITVTSLVIPSLNLGGAPVAPGASAALAVTILAQMTQAIAASGATSGTFIYPPGSGTSVGTWTYTAAT